MKINNLITDFEIALTNEEQELLRKIKGVMVPEQFTERERFIIENMIRKSVVSRVNHKGKAYLVRNEKHPI